jgi:hypothetical protein
MIIQSIPLFLFLLSVFIFFPPFAILYGRQYFAAFFFKALTAAGFFPNNLAAFFPIRLDSLLQIYSLWPMWKEYICIIGED